LQRPLCVCNECERRGPSRRSLHLQQCEAVGKTKRRSHELEERSLRPADDTDTPNGNPPGVAPASVGKPDYTPGDPAGLVLVDEGAGGGIGRTLFHASPWDGWPAEWSLPGMSRAEDLIDTAWAALDLNSSVFASMPPYLVGASPNLPDGWIDNPDPDRYNSWADFAHGLMWDFQLGEAFVVCTSRYANGWPARFHLIPPWLIEPELTGTGRTYKIGSLELDPADVLHLRYRSTVDQARGTGPLDAGRARLVAAGVLLRYVTQFVTSGAVPSGVLESEEEVTSKQAEDLHAQWIAARMAKLGLPAVLGGGVSWKATQINPLQSALTELAAYTEAKISVLLGVPPFLLSLPSGGDSMTYSNVSSVFDYHWRGGLRPKAQRVMTALAQWLVPLGTGVEVNRDEYVKPGPLERAQTWEIYLRNGVVDVETVQTAERFTSAGTTTASPVSGVLK
jgi:HK97 family phage portal protein